MHAAIAKPDRGAVGDAAIVDLGEETLVVDTHFSSPAARELRAAAEELTGRPAAWVLNTHWHNDHVLGNGEFEAATVVSTTRTRELIATVESNDSRRRSSGWTPSCRPSSNGFARRVTTRARRCWRRVRRSCGR